MSLLEIGRLTKTDFQQLKTAMKKRIYLTVTAFFSLVVLTIAFIVLPFFYGIKQNSSELAFQKEKLAGLERKISNLEKFKVLEADLQQFLKRVNDLFVDSRVPIDFIGFLEKTSKACFLETQILSVSERRTEKDFWPYLDFQVISSGSFSDFLKFLEKIENGPYLVELQNITINKLTEEKDFISGKVKVVFSLRVFAK